MQHVPTATLTPTPSRQSVWRQLPVCESDTKPARRAAAPVAGGAR